MEQRYIDDIVDKYEEAMEHNQLNVNFDNLYENSDDDEEEQNDPSLQILDSQDAKLQKFSKLQISAK